VRSQPLADAGALVDLRVLACLKRHFLDHFAYEIRNVDSAAFAPLEPRFLRRDRHGVVPRRWVVRADFRTDAVLQRVMILPRAV
jgi:hypothetical protein